MIVTRKILIVSFIVLILTIFKICYIFTYNLYLYLVVINESLETFTLEIFTSTSTNSIDQVDDYKIHYLEEEIEQDEQG